MDIEDKNTYEIDKFKDPKIKVLVGEISFPEYSLLLEQAEEISRRLSTISVNEENIKESKKVLARVNKSIKELNDRRIKIKKDLMAPYDDFAEKIKNIESVIKEADELVRSQVRELEEKEREEKRQEIEEIWNKRIGQYSYAKIFTFGDFLENKHLNKTITLKSVEEEMTERLEQWERDIKTLSSMELKDELINEYKDCKDISLAIEIVKSKEEEIKRQKEIFKNEDLEVKKIYIFKIKDEKDAKLTEMLLKENNIEFDMEEI